MGFSNADGDSHPTARTSQPQWSPVVISFSYILFFSIKIKHLMFGLIFIIAYEFKQSFKKFNIPMIMMPFNCINHS